MVQKNADACITIIICIVFGVITTLGLYTSNLNTVLSLILTVLALLAFSIIRDRETGVNKKDNAPESFEQQEDSDVF